MKVKCDHCGKEYDVREDRIKEEGSKVRCSNCKNVFVIHKPADAGAASPAEEPAPPPPPEPAPQSDSGHVSVACPSCGAGSRIRADKVPEKGAWARCPGCRERIFVTRTPPAPEPEPSPPVDETDRAAPSAPGLAETEEEATVDESFTALDEDEFGLGPGGKAADYDSLAETALLGADDFAEDDLDVDYEEWDTYDEVGAEVEDEQDYTALLERASGGEKRPRRSRLLVLLVLVLAAAAAVYIYPRAAGEMEKRALLPAAEALNRLAALPPTEKAYPEARKALVEAGNAISSVEGQSERKTDLEKAMGYFETALKIRSARLEGANEVIEREFADVCPLAEKAAAGGLVPGPLTETAAQLSAKACRPLFFYSSIVPGMPDKHAWAAEKAEKLLAGYGRILVKQWEERNQPLF